MTVRPRAIVLLAWMGLAVGTPASGQHLDLPPRPDGAPTGSEVARSIAGLNLDAREHRIVSEFLRGNVPSWLRALRPVHVRTDSAEIVFWVTPDVFAIGSDTDYLRMPMTPEAAQRIADVLAMALPTPAMADAIWAAAEVRLAPSPIPPSPAMTTVPVFAAHSDTVDAQLRRAGAAPGAFLAGHKKDVVVSRDLAAHPGRVAIYGWHQLDGAPIQPLYLGHTADWVDYSHGIRLVSRRIRVDGRWMDLWEALRSLELARALSREGVLTQPFYIMRR